MSLKYWRVSLTNGESLDVEAEEVKVDGQNNLIFSIYEVEVALPRLIPVTACNKGHWGAFKMIDKLKGKALHSYTWPPD